jgi:large subunit ribosomal protein L9
MGKTAVILKQKLENLGEAGDLVSVSAGFARNYLLPKNLCVLAGKQELAELEVRKEQIRKKAEKDRNALSAVSQKISELTLTVPVKVGETGKLFGSVTTMHISELLLSHEIKIDKKDLHLEHPVKEVGEYQVMVNLGHGLHASLKINVIAE